MAMNKYLWALLLVQPTWLLAGEIVYQGLPSGPAQIKEDRQGRIYVAVFGQHGVIVRSDARGARVWKQGRIDGLEITPDGDVWLSHGGRILRNEGGQDDIAHVVDRTASFQPQTTPGGLFASRSGDLWSKGCLRMRRRDGMFVAATFGGPKGWAVVPVCDDPFGNVWAIATGPDGARQDFAVLTRDQPHRWQMIGLPEPPAAGPWYDARADDSGFVWLVSKTKLLRVDPRVDPRADASGQRVIASPVEAPITAIARVANRQIVVGFSDGSIRELNVEADRQPSWKTIAAVGSGPVRAMLHDRRGRLWAIRDGDLVHDDSLRAEWHQHWEEQPRLPAGNHDLIFARIGDKLYTAGGKTFFGWPASTWVNMDHVWSYDINRGIWSVEPPMLEPGKAYPGIAALDGELWLVGGNFRDGERTKSTSTVEIYNPRTRRYRLGPSIGEPRDQIVALTVNNRLYAIGGHNEGKASDQMISIAAGETDWRSEPPAPGPIMQASGCVVAGKLYIAAGPRSKCPGLFVYDPQQRAWSQVKHPAATPPRAALCAAYQDEVWVMGGRGTDRGLVATHVYSPRTGQWKQGPDLPLPVSWGAAAEVNGRLLIASGAYREPHVGNYFNSDRAFLLRRE